MEKFFDKESLIDTMNTLDKKGKISNKSYRLWYRLNEDARIAVKTSVGETRTKRVKNSLGQGMFGAALASSLNIGCAIEETFNVRPSTKIGFVNLNSLILQDDISKMNDNINQAKEGCRMIDNILKKKQLSVNYDKSKYMIIGNEKYRNEVKKDIENNPMMMGNVKIGHSEKEKYLGDIIHEKGIVESISATIKARTNGLISKCDEIIKICESPVMGGTGNSVAAIRLFEAQIIPSLLNNCESWIGLNQTHLSDLQDFQDKFIRKLLWLPISTPKAILHWDTDMKLMKWRIAERKLKFASKIMIRENSNITKRVMMCEVLEGINGLANECKIISEEIGLANVVTQSVSKGEIKRAICEKDKEEKRQDMENSKKVGDRLTDNPTDNSYLSVMPLHLSRVWIRYRAKMCKGVKYNNKRLYKDLQCKFCTSGEEETQEHLEVCDGTEFERRGLKMSVRSDLVKFWSRMEKKMLWKKIQDKKEEEKNKNNVATDT